MYVVMTRRELAVKLGLSTRQVIDALTRYHICKPIRKKHKQWTAEEIEIIRENYKAMPAKELAALLKVSTAVLWGTVQRYGLMKRSRQKKEKELQAV